MPWALPARDKATLVWDDFRGGLNTQIPADQLSPSFSPDCQNVKATRAGAIVTRPGYSKYVAPSLAATFRRIIDFQYGSSQKLLVQAGTDLNYWTGAAWTSILASIAAVPIGWENFHDYLFISDGVLTRRYDGTNTRNWGIVAPTTAPTLAAYVAGTHMNGIYKYRETYVRGGTNGAESNAGVESAALSVAGDGISLSAIPVSADPQVTARKFYRVQGNGETFYYAFTISDNSTTTYDDDLPDTSLDTTILAPEDHTPPAAARFIKLFKTRLWMLEQSGRSITFSELDEPEYFPPENLFNLSTRDADIATGVEVLGDALFAFTEDSIWMITAGYSTASMTVAAVPGNVGCVAPGSLVSTKDMLIFLADDGVYAFNGSQVQSISRDLIDPTLDALTLAQKQAAVGCWMPTLHEYWLSFPTAGTPFVMVYDTIGQCWHPYTHTLNAMGAFETSAGTPAYLGGNATYLWQLETGTSDDGVAIAWYRRSPVFDTGDSTWIKCAQRFFADAKAAGAYAATLNLYCDWSGTPSPPTPATLTLSANREIIRQDLHGNGWHHQIKVSGSGGNLPVEISRIILEMRPLRRK